VSFDSSQLAAQIQEIATYVDNLEQRLLEKARAVMLQAVFKEIEPVKVQLLGAISEQAANTWRALGDKEKEMHQHFENRLQSLNENLVKHIETNLVEMHQHFENRLQSLNENLVKHIEITTTASQSVLEMGDDRIRDQIRQLRREVDDFRAATAGTSVVNVWRSANSDKEIVDSQFYAALEDRFRGSEPKITERQRYYLPEINDIARNQRRVIDLGCGRGEWLTLLQSEGVVCSGVDSNPVMISRCRELGLEVEHADLVSYVSTLPDSSAGAITLFQVAEHLSLANLLVVLRESRRVLVDGGKLIAEVPNAKNVRVGSGTFWIDPTHERPIFPEFLEFLAEYVGFKSVKGAYLNRLSPLTEPKDLGAELSAFVQSVTEALNGPADFALIATA
jgi:SAM-dependent methyltransferase